jgi:hypothetical protein
MTDVSSVMDLGVGVGGGASAITEGSVVEGEGERRAWEGAVRGREEQFAARGVRDAGRKTRAAAGITGGMWTPSVHP